MITVLMASLALAQEAASDGFDAYGLQLAAFDGDVRDPMAVDRPYNLNQGAWWVGGLVGYAERSLVYRTVNPDDSYDDVAMLDNTFALHLSGGGVVYDRIRLELAAPLFLTSTSDGQGQGAALGDLRLGSMVALLDEANDDPLGLGAGLYLDLPTGNDALFLGQSGVSGTIKASATRSLGDITVGGDLGLRFNPKVDLENLTGSDDLLLGAAFNYLIDEQTSVGAEARLAAPFTASDERGTATPAEGMLTARHRTESGGFVSGGLGTALSGGAGAAAFRLVLGGGFGVSDTAPKDTDGDGFLDKVDGCVDAPETQNGFKDDDGCPDQLGTMAIRVEYGGKRIVGAMVEVNDGQNPTASKTTGKVDVELPAIPGKGWTASAYYGACLAGKGAKLAGEGKTEWVIELEPAWTAGVTLEVVTAKGQPVQDAKLIWATEEGGCVPLGEGPTDANGKLEQVVGEGKHTWMVQAEGYGAVRGTVELAADETEPIKVVLNPTKVKVTLEQITILDTVQFETAKAVIKPESFALLDEVATTIATHPQMKKIEVAGHTDDQGNDASNLKLSQDRANSVRTYLISKGIEEARLTAVGYGETKPVAPNRTASGRAQNRRVEFKILEQSKE